MEVLLMLLAFIFMVLTGCGSMLAIGLMWVWSQDDD